MRRLDDQRQAQLVGHLHHALARQALRGSATYFGVGRPTACQMRLVITLSMAIAEAITPEPV